MSRRRHGTVSAWIGAALLAPAAPADSAEPARSEVALPEAVVAVIDRAESGDPEAQYQLGRLYLGDEIGGATLTRDPVAAARWLRRAAKGGHAGAAERLAAVEKSEVMIRDDPEGAFDFYLEAAEAGDAAAQGMVGELYREGVGVDADDDEALRWLERAARRGDRDAQAALGSMYEEGRGVAADPSAAASWFRKAAEAGHKGAQFNLGAMYLNGVGVTADPVEAVMWLSIAADEVASARFLLYTKERELAPEAIEEGRRRAAARGARLRPITPASPSVPSPL